MADFNFIIGADDAEFRAAMQRTEGAASKSLGRIGSVVEARTAGFRKLAASVSGVAGVFTSMIGVVTLVAGGVYALTQAFDLFGTKAEERAKQVRDSIDSINDSMNSLRRSSGMLGDADFLRLQFAELDSRIRQQQLAIRPQKDLAYSTYSGRYQMEGMLAPELSDEEQRLVKLQEEGYQILQKQLQSLRKKEQAQKDELRTKIQILAMSETEASLANELVRLDKLAAQAKEEGMNNELSLLSRIRQQTIEAHNQKLQQIEEEREAKRRAEQDAMDAQMRQQQFSAEMLRMQLEMEIARATGDEDAARAIQKQIELERRRNEIMGMEGLTIQKRLDLLRLAGQIFNATSPDAASMFAGGGGSSPTAMAGLSLTPTLFNQVFGGQSAAQNMDRERNSTLKDIRGELKVIAKNTGRPAGAVYG